MCKDRSLGRRDLWTLAGPNPRWGLAQELVPGLGGSLGAEVGAGPSLGLGPGSSVGHVLRASKHGSGTESLGTAINGLGS